MEEVQTTGLATQQKTPQKKVRKMNKLVDLAT
jgi:hypothetical protein